MLSYETQSNIPCTEDDLQKSIQDIMSSDSPNELWHAMILLITCDEYQQVELDHFNCFL